MIRKAGLVMTDTIAEADSYMPSDKCKLCVDDSDGNSKGYCKLCINYFSVCKVFHSDIKDNKLNNCGSWNIYSEYNEQ